MAEGGTASRPAPLQNRSRRKGIMSRAENAANAARERGARREIGDSWDGEAAYQRFALEQDNLNRERNGGDRKMSKGGVAKKPTKKK